MKHWQERDSAMERVKALSAENRAALERFEVWLGEPSGLEEWCGDIPLPGEVRLKGIFSSMTSEMTTPEYFYAFFLWVIVQEGEMWGTPAAA